MVFVTDSGDVAKVVLKEIRVDNVALSRITLISVFFWNALHAIESHGCH